MRSHQTLLRDFNLNEVLLAAIETREWDKKVHSQHREHTDDGECGSKSAYTRESHRNVYVNSTWCQGSDKVIKFLPSSFPFSPPRVTNLRVPFEMKFCYLFHTTSCISVIDKYLSIICYSRTSFEMIVYIVTCKDNKKFEMEVYLEFIRRKCGEEVTDESPMGCTCDCRLIIR